MLVFGTALLGALLLTGLLLPLLRRQFMDLPNHRSSHVHPVPRGGGIAVLLAAFLACGVAALRGVDLPWMPLVAAGLLAGVGLVDDVRSLPSMVRLVLQFFGGVAVAVWASRDVGTSGLAAAIFLGVAVLLVVAYVNAFNFMDGVNAISSLNAAVSGLWWVWLGGQFDLDGLRAVGLATAGAMLGFLPWNAPRARAFLGDVGSYGVGVLIASMSVWGWAAGVPFLLAVAPLVIYAADTGWVLVKRVLGGRPVTEAHREHVYQRLVDDRRWNHLAAGGSTAIATLLTCVVLWLTRDGWLTGLTAVGVVVLGYLASPSVGRTEKGRAA